MKYWNKVEGLWPSALLLAVTVLTIAPVPCNLRIAELPGSSEKQGREGTSDVFAVDHELVQPIDPGTGTATGMRQHRALTVLKQIDKATPGLHRALVTGQNLQEAALDFYRIDPATRVETKYYTITLRMVRVVGVKTMMPTSFLPENQAYEHMEEVRLVYESVEWNWIPDSVVEQDEWRGSGAALATADSLRRSAATAVGQSSNPETPSRTPDSSGRATRARPASRQE